MCIGLLADGICSAFIDTVSAVYSQEACLFFLFAFCCGQMEDVMTGQTWEGCVRLGQARGGVCSISATHLLRVVCVELCQHFLLSV